MKKWRPDSFSKFLVILNNHPVSIFLSSPDNSPVPNQTIFSFIISLSYFFSVLFDTQCVTYLLLYFEEEMKTRIENLYNSKLRSRSSNNNICKNMSIFSMIFPIRAWIVLVDKWSMSCFSHFIDWFLIVLPRLFFFFWIWSFELYFERCFTTI